MAIPSTTYIPQYQKNFYQPTIQTPNIPQSAERSVRISPLSVHPKKGGNKILLQSLGIGSLSGAIPGALMYGLLEFHAMTSEPFIFLQSFQTKIARLTKEIFKGSVALGMVGGIIGIGVGLILKSKEE